MSPGFGIQGIGQEGRVMRKLLPRQEDPIMVCVQIDGWKERKKRCWGWDKCRERLIGRY